MTETAWKTELERRLVEAVSRGVLVDLSSGDPALDNPNDGADWMGSRVVRAELIVQLVTGTGLPKSGRPRALRLKGARVGGTLDLEAAVLKCPLVLMNCHVDEPINLREAQAAAIRLPGCHVPGITADQLQVRGDLDLKGVVTRNAEVCLIGAHIGGKLELDGASLSNPNGYALNADGLKVDQDMFCKEKFVTQGEVRLPGAHIGGNLELDGASLSNPNGYALNADGLKVNQDMFCKDKIVTHGEVRLLGAHIGGQLVFDGANLTNVNGPALNAVSLSVDQGMFCREGFTAHGGVRLPLAHIGGNLDFRGANLTSVNGPALNADSLTVEQSVFCRKGFTAKGEVRLSGARIGGDLDFTDANLTNPHGPALDLKRAHAVALILLPKTPPKGVVDLTNARVGSFYDNPTGWPAVSPLRLRGFTYEVLENDSVDVRTRLNWLALHEGGYAPGLYDQLAAAYRRTGHVEAARRVAIAKQWRRRRELKPLGKVWNWLLYLTVGYGYRPWLAGLWLGGLLVIGAMVFTGAHPNHMRSAATSVPEFQPVAYTLDVLLPIVDFGQEKAWIPLESARMWSWTLTAAGWVLTTAVVAGLTNALKRD